MKALIITLFLSLTTTLFSQNFGLVGTEWYYGVKDQSCNTVCDYIHYKSVKDTLIQGTLAYKIEQTYYGEIDTLYSDFLYVYNQADTTFAYSFVKSRFLKLFIFNGNQGDTLTLDYPPHYFIPPFSFTDSTYRLVIDTVIQQNINGVPLKKYHTTGLDGVHFYSNYNSFMDRIGGLDMLLPRGGAIIPEHIGPIRCYKDAAIDTSFTVNACDFFSTTAVPEEGIAVGLKLYPNPSSNRLIIENLGQQKEEILIEVRNVTGKLALAQKTTIFESITIDISKIPNGIYFVTVKEKNEILTTQKWVKME